MFKKILIGACAVISLTACTEDFKDWKEQTAICPVDPQNITLSAKAAFEKLDLNTVTEERVKLFTMELPANVTADGYDVELNTPAGNPYTISADVDGTVAVADLQNALISLYNREPVERELIATVKGLAKITGVQGDATINIQSANNMLIAVTTKKSEYVEYLYVPGNMQGWNPGTASALHSPAQDGIYTGYAYLDGGFKLTKAKDWDHGDYGKSAFDSAPEFLDVNGDGDIICNEPGLYKLTVDLTKGSISAVKINTLTLIGSAINGDSSWNTDSEPMTWDSTLAAYKLVVTLTKGEYKIRADQDWAISWGYVSGSTEKLTTNSGGNISAAAGTYLIVFKPSADGDATITVTPTTPED